MESLRQIGIGVLIAVVSIIVILGGYSLSTAEGFMATSPSATGTYELVIPTSLPITPTLTIEATGSPVPTDTPTPTSAIAQIDTPLPTINQYPTLAYQATTSSCQVPLGWIPIVVHTYDTVGTIAQTYRMSTYTLMQGNCLTSDQLRPGSLLYVQTIPAPTYIVNSVPCGAPYGWINYYVVAGDTLYNIGGRYRVTVSELQQANCMGSSTYLQVGKSLKVPNVATTAPLATSATQPNSQVVTQTSAPTVTMETPASPTVVPPSPTSIPSTPTVPPPTIAPGNPSPTPFSNLTPG